METMNEENRNKYALVTGATSGIGNELAKRLAKEGYNLIIVARMDDRLQQVAVELRQTYNVEVIPLSKDLFEKNASKEIYAEVRQMDISVDVLINDAGQGEWGAFIETDLQRQLDIIQLNIGALVSLTYYFMKDMVNRNEGKILQLGSEVSKIPMPLMSVYAATKAFVLSFTEALIHELKDTNVTMTLLMPGATDTDFFHKAGAEDTVTYREAKMDEPEKVAEEAFDALMKGERRLIVGSGKMHVAMANIVPDNVMAANLKKQMEPSKEDPEKSRTQSEHQASREEREALNQIPEGQRHSSSL